jgi:hypothetical protein
MQMTSMSPPSLASFSRASAALLFAALTGAAAAPALAQFTVDRELKFAVPNDKWRAAMRQAPAAREIAAGDFVIAAEDLNGDGKREVILLARSPSLCPDSRCTLLVMQRSANGIDTLLLQRVPVPLAVTKEKVNGYHAIAALDARGQIAVGDRRDAGLSGKPLVYVMRVGALAPEASAASRPATAAPNAAATARPGGKSTLEDVVNTIAQASDQKEAKVDWTSMERIPGLKMRQAKDALIETPKGYRRGGQVALEGLGSTSVTWQGSIEGAYTVDVRTGARIQKDQYGAALKQQFSAAARLKQIRGGCKGNDWDRDSAIFQLNLPNRKPMFLLVNTTSSDNNGNTTIQVAPEVENWWAC